MIYLGAERSVTQDYNTHKTAEDYSGAHKSVIKMNGVGRVTRIINRFHSHEDSINYNTFLQNQKNWWDGTYYNCISITGKKVPMKIDEVGGNQIWIETYVNNTKRTLHFAHLDSVLVSVNQFVDENTVLGLQGNTGLVLSSKATTDPSYGTHVHFEVQNEFNQYMNPREYSDGTIITTYPNGSNPIDKDKNQIHILVQQINIRLLPDETSKDIGDVYYDEYYDVLEKKEDENYIWYKIKTKYNIEGYVASKKEANWLEYIPKEAEATPDIPIIPDNPTTPNDGKEHLKLIFEATKEDYYYLLLKVGDKLYLEEKE